jgi:hypothetical protein
VVVGFDIFRDIVLKGSKGYTYMEEKKKRKKNSICMAILIKQIIYTCA